MPPIVTSLLVGMIVGAINGTSIFFIKEETNKGAVFAATILRNGFVGLLTYYTLTVQTKWWGALLSGTVYGFLLGMVVLLAKGGFRSKHHLVILPFSALTGAAIGLVLWKLFY